MNDTSERVSSGRASALDSVRTCASQASADTSGATTGRRVVRGVSRDQSGTGSGLAWFCSAACFFANVASALR